MTITTRGRTGKVFEKREPLGGVFALVKGQRVSQTYGIGPEGAKDRHVMLTCPVSAIPGVVWDLVSLWNGCRLTGVLPVAGGFLDQPEVIRRTFPVLAAEYKAAQELKGARSQEATSAHMLGALMAAVGSRGRG